MNDKEPKGVDFSQFFYCIRRASDGKITSGAAFDREAFAHMFGEEAANAIKQYLHFCLNTPITTETKNKFREAKETLRRVVGVEPSQIRTGKKNARIIDA